MLVDAIADIAVMGPPDSQTLMERAGAYEELVESGGPFVISGVPPETPALLVAPIFARPIDARAPPAGPTGPV